MTAQPGTATGTAKLQAGVALGDYVLGQPLWPLRIADAYRANGPTGPATIYVIHANIAQTAAVRDQIIAGTRTAAALPEHKHYVRTLAAGLTGDILWIATEEVDGSLVRDMLIKKRQAGTSGFGVRGTANLITGVAGALGDAIHGALSTESVIVSRTGRVRVTDLALGPGTLAAMRAGLIPMQNSVAPEVQQNGTPSRQGDSYAVGALLYEALVGAPLERGGPRPSEVVQGASPQIDEVVARACHRDPEKRFPRADVIGEIVAEALGKGGEPPPGPAAAAVEPGAGQSLNMKLASSSDSAGIASGNTVVDRALAAALADTTEKFLISKGRLDYGPFSLKDVLAQIKKGEIVSGNIIIDKDTGARMDVGKHPLLGPMVDAAKQALDDARRAQAEVHHEKVQKKRGAMLFVMIGAAVVALGLAIWFIVGQVKGKKDDGAVAGVEKVGAAQLSVTFSQPKVPPKQPKKSGGSRGGSRGGGGGGDNGDAESLALDMSDEDDESGSEKLDMGTIYNVYSRYGSQLGGCMSRAGTGYALISIIIDGPSGKVTFVRVNGQKGGALAECIGRVMRSMKFPPVNGTRTRAEFDISL
jgi:hypothetical protein